MARPKSKNRKMKNKKSILTINLVPNYFPKTLKTFHRELAACIKEVKKQVKKG